MMKNYKCPFCKRNLSHYIGMDEKYQKYYCYMCNNNFAIYYYDSKLESLVIHIDNTILEICNDTIKINSQIVANVNLLKNIDLNDVYNSCSKLLDKFSKLKSFE